MCSGVVGGCGVDVGNIEALSTTAATLRWHFRERKGGRADDAHGLVAVLLKLEEQHGHGLVAVLLTMKGVHLHHGHDCHRTMGKMWLRYLEAVEWMLAISMPYPRRPQPCGSSSER